MCYCRPDTTWERENKDFYSPDCVNEILWAPVAFARISKAGKCIGKKFTARYYDSVAFGMMMYCRTSDTSDRAFTSCVDHTSILPMPLFNTEVLDTDNDFEVTRNGEKLFSQSSGGGMWRNILEDALSTASQLTSLRIGDLVAVELAHIQTLATRQDSGIAIKGTFCNNDMFDFKIIF